jgi:uroporphyrin-III C-methyltransferase
MAKTATHLCEFGLRLNGRRVLVADAGDATPALVQIALHAGAQVTVCGGPTPPPGSDDMNPGLTRNYTPPSLPGIFLCLTTDPALAGRARAAGVLCGVPGHPELSDVAGPWDALPTTDPDPAAVPSTPAPALARPSPPVASPRSHALGRASLVGAGPGDPALLTLRALQVLATADLVLHDRLVGPEILALAPPHARRVDVGKRCGRHAMTQAAINRLLVREALAGAHVVRLKGGDPFIFGRGGEELDCLRDAGLDVEVVPGVTAACAAAARLGIPLTHRDVSRSLHLVTGHGSDNEIPALDWGALAATRGTLALYMSTRTLDGVAARLIAGGMNPATPAVAVENVSLPGERVRLATLATLPALLAGDPGEGPTLVIVGEVVARVRVGALRAA